MHPLSFKKWRALPAALIIAGAVAACAPTVRLETPQPVKIDVGMRVDVYSHDQKPDRQADTVNPQNSTPEQRRFSRRSEVQALKNNRVIGEANNGTLAVREKPADPVYAAYAERVVREENEDRQAEYAARAKELNRPVATLIQEATKSRREGSFPGEWVQLDNGDWTQR